MDRVNQPSGRPSTLYLGVRSATTHTVRVDAPAHALNVHP
ncbi:hypothetical protein E2C01_066472 [Portunus trituberculatus]|uniref:Uncharacterized protein n=1 Tax=Portunus trituberculatus TaxID=210409 RepID=A0A5B7HQK8_PORTR|nr:hypothetical protein [Portunus trituberculatus]